MKQLPAHRPTRLDADKAIFRPNANIYEDSTDINEEIERGYVCYTLFGKHDDVDENGNPVIHVDEDHPNVFAKLVVLTGKNPHYFVRSTANGHFFNPMGIDNESHLKVANKTGRREYEFVAVNKKVFQLYVHFLKTKNHAHLRTAQREYK